MTKPVTTGSIRAFVPAGQEGHVRRPDRIDAVRRFMADRTCLADLTMGERFADLYTEYRRWRVATQDWNEMLTPRTFSLTVARLGIPRAQVRTESGAQPMTYFGVQLLRPEVLLTQLGQLLTQPQPVAPAAEPKRRDHNNGWHKPITGQHRALDVEEACLLDVKPSAPRARDLTPTDDHQPGREIPLEWRKQIVTPVRRQGWRYLKHSGSGRGKPRLVSPDGHAYFLGKTPSDWRALHNARAALRNLGAAL